MTARNTQFYIMNIKKKPSVHINTEKLIVEGSSCLQISAHM